MSGQEGYSFGAYRLDPRDKTLYRDGTPVALTPKALDTLAVLVERHPLLVSRDELLARVWPGTFVEDNNLAQHISLLRRVLAEGTGTDPVIETVPRRGYRFRPTVTRFEVEPPVESSVEPAPDAAGAVAAGPAGPGARRRAAWLGAAVAASLLLAVAAATVRQPDAGPREAREGEGAPPSSRDPEAHLAYLGGRAAFSQGYSDTANQARARTDLERAVALDPGFAPAWALLAQVYGAQYRSAHYPDAAILDASERAARMAVTLDPRLPEGHLALADVFFSRRDNQRARAALEAGRPLLEGDAQFWHHLGFLEQREGHWRASEKAFATAFDLDGPATAEALAVHFLHLRQYADARRVVAVALASNRSAAVVPQSWALFSERGDVASARAVLEPALRSRPRPDARVRGFLAQLEWFDGHGQRALELIDAMEAPGAWLAPNFRFPAAIAAGDVLATLGRDAEARARYGEALIGLEHRRRDAPDDPKLLAALGLAYAGLGRAAEAVSHAERTVALRPRTEDAAEGPLYLYLLARVHARLGNVAAAAAALDAMFDGPSFYSEAWVEHDPSFAQLRADPSYAAHLERWTSQKGDALLASAPALHTQ